RRGRRGVFPLSPPSWGERGGSPPPGGAHAGDDPLKKKPPGKRTGGGGLFFVSGGRGARPALARSVCEGEKKTRSARERSERSAGRSKPRGAVPAAKSRVSSLSRRTKSPSPAASSAASMRSSDSSPRTASTCVRLTVPSPIA